MTTNAIAIVPIHDREAERAVLGALLRANEFIDDVSQIIQADDFYIFAHKKSFSGMLELHGAAKRVDAVTLADWLNERNLIQDVGGYGFLVELFDAAPSALNATRYAAIVREKATRRELDHIGREIQRQAADCHGSADELQNEIVAQVMALAERRLKSELVSGAEASRLAIDRTDERSRGGNDRSVLTGLTAVDDMTRGFGDGHLGIIAARTSQGKTALALWIAYHAGFECELPTLLFSLEQDRFEIGDRINSIRTGIDSYKFRQPQHLTDYDAELLAQIGQFFKGKPLHISDGRCQTTNQLAAVAREFKRKHGLRLLVVDYLQLLKFGDGNGWIPRHEQIAAITRDLKSLARELSCPVIALSQLNRDLEKRADKRPQLSDLRESGSIEQDADTVLLLQAPDEDTVKNEPSLKDTLCVVIAKQRAGPTGTVTIRFDRATGRMENFSWDNVPAQPFASRRR